MRKLSDTELLNLNKMLQMETNQVTKTKAMITAINDEDLRRISETFIAANEVRIKGIQQFINENNIISNLEVH